jgi:methyl-accepting chemotaxis protein
MSPKPRKYRRRNYYIDKDFQTKFILKFCSLVAFGSALTVALIYWLARHSTTVGIAHGHVAVHTTAEYLLPLLLQTVFVVLVVVSLAAIVMTLLFTHKIAGPLHRLKVMLGQLGEGDFLSSMRLREGDQLQQVAAAYNEAVEKINGKIKKAKNASSLDEVKNTLNTFKT